ncbi:hypothetical protein [Burkholderia territorii]|uniref:hypothetical protein n=1 Tax=Burkholderia territorii TaxID=1503055 RepID=UPI000A7B1245|nr:hypothetical protein [Burkholderia territorii]
MKYAKHKPEPTQPGNPHQLTKNQHVFPDASIARFEHAEEGITAILLDRDQRISNLCADNKLFCANRVWDQRAESGYMASIESEFQFLARRLIAGDLRWLEPMQPTITRFYALWEQRAHYALNPVPAAKLKGVTPAADMTKDFKERLEKAHVSYVDDGSTWPSRQMTGMRIQFNIDQRQMELADLKWTLCRATPDAGEFLVPDKPVAFCIPLTPTMALVANSDLDLVGPAAMQFINLHTLHMSTRYVFAHDLSRCFLTGRRQLTMPPLPRKLKLDLFPGVGVTLIGNAITRIGVHEHRTGDTTVDRCRPKAEIRNSGKRTFNR